MELPEAFCEKLHSGLQKRRQQGLYLQLSPVPEDINAIDFGSNNSLGLRLSKSLREQFQIQLQRNPDFNLGAGSSRVLDGSNKHVMDLEARLVNYHGAKDGLLFNSGYEANMAIFSNLPQAGDAVVHDSLIHASILDGCQASKATIIRPFEHNDADSLRNVLQDIKSHSQEISEAKRTIFVSIESFYSMDGDAAPVSEILHWAKQVLPLGNVVFIIDEAHATGLLGPHGSGFARHLGMEKEFHIQMQSYTKAPSASSAIVLCDPLVKQFLVNYARSLVYSTGPTFPTIALLHASINILESAEGNWRREQLQKRIRLFYSTLLRQPEWNAIEESGVLRIPTAKSEDAVRYNIPIVPLITSPGLCHDLHAWLLQSGYRTHTFVFPVVPKTEERLRLMINCDQTPQQIHDVIRLLMVWAEKRATPVKGPNL